MLQSGPEFAAWRASRPARAVPPDAQHPVSWWVEGDTVHVVLNRPDRHNAVSSGLRDQLVEPLRLALADPGLTDERIHLFVARDLREAPRALDADELIEVSPVPLARAYRMADAGEILDAGTLVALYRFRGRAAG